MGLDWCLWRSVRTAASMGGAALGIARKTVRGLITEVRRTALPDNMAGDGDGPGRRGRGSGIVI